MTPELWGNYLSLFAARRASGWFSTPNTYQQWSAEIGNAFRNASAST
jgi:hypothetical protein